MKRVSLVLTAVAILMFCATQAGAQARCPVCGGEVYSSSPSRIPYSSYYQGNLPGTGMESYNPPGYYYSQPYRGYYGPEYYQEPYYGTRGYYDTRGYYYGQRYPVQDEAGAGHMTGHPQSGTGKYTSPTSPW